MARSVSYPSGVAALAFDRFDGEDAYDWQDYADEIILSVKAAYPSVRESERWLNREDQVLAMNEHAYFGVSEYMGLVSIWVLPRAETDYLSGPEAALSDAWCAKIAPGFERCFGSLVKVGSFSNGEAIYKPKAGAPALEDNLSGPLVVNGALVHGVYGA